MLIEKRIKVAAKSVDAETGVPDRYPIIFPPEGIPILPESIPDIRVPPLQLNRGVFWKSPINAVHWGKAKVPISITKEKFLECFELDTPN